MQRQIVRGASAGAGLIFHVFVQDSTATDGSGKSGLVFSDFSCRYVRNGEAISGAITPQTIATLGTYAAPDANTNIRIAPVDDSNMPGVYEIQIHLDWVNSTNSCQSLTIFLTASGAAALPVQIILVAYNPQDGVRLGLTALPNAAADGVGGLPISDAGGLDLDSIKAKTDNLPPDPADASDIAALFAALPSAGDVAGAVWAATGLLGKNYATMIAEIDAAQIIRIGQFQAGSTTQALVLDAGASGVDDFYNRTTITIATGASAGQNRIINDYDGTSQTAYLDRPVLVGAPAAGAYFAIDSRGNMRSASDLAIGLAQGGDVTYIDLQATESAENDFYNRMLIMIESGTGAGQARLIEDYIGSSKRALVARDWITPPDNTSRYVILPFGSVAVSGIDGEAVDEIMDRTAGVETGMTLRQAQRLILAALAGKLSGAATTSIAIRDTNDTKNRISATVDTDGNRTAVTLDAS